MRFSSRAGVLGNWTPRLRFVADSLGNPIQRASSRIRLLKDRILRKPDQPLPEIAWYMDLGARGKRVWGECPAHLKEELGFFLDHGYVVLRNSVPGDVVEKARAEFQAHKRKYAEHYKKHEDENGYQRRIVNLHLALDGFKALYTRNRRALEIQDYLFQRSSACYTSLTFEAGSEQDMHRDSPYFRTSPEYYYLGVWTSLEATDEKNGALMLYDGGHLLQEPDREAIYSKYYRRGDAFDDFDPRLWEEYQSLVAAQCEQRGFVRKIVPMSPGDTLIWHPHLPHGGAPIIERHRSRLSIVNHVIPVDVPVSGQSVFYGHALEPKHAKHNYEVFEGRRFLQHGEVQFNHADPRPVGKFRL